jgi:Na+/H+-dicarboxylate symporter
MADQEAHAQTYNPQPSTHSILNRLQSIGLRLTLEQNSAASVFNWFEKYLIVYVIAGLIAGIAVASISQPLVDRVDSTVNLFMELYGFVAPVAIFLILAPSLARLFSTRSMGRFGLFAIRWYAVRKILASLWAIIFILIVFRIPLLPQGSVSLADGVGQTLNSLGVMAATSPYFWAMYTAIVAALISMRVERLASVLERILSGLEQSGSYLMPVMPIFMFAIGAYIYGLPQNVQEQVGLEANGIGLLTDINIWGWSISPASSTGMIVIYVLGAVLTAIACFIWQFVFLLVARKHEPRFSIGSYFRDYWIKVYPLLWATSSEALATPLNLYLTKKHAPWVRRDVRRFIIGVGSYMNINGTLINVFVLGAIVLLMLGLNVSVVELLLVVPVVFLISYGVPGIPGELVLFAGPMATVLNIPVEVLPIFLAIYLGIQIGLPDSFRTGSNSTDDYIGSVLMNAIYEQRYATDEEAAQPVPASQGRRAA